MTLAQLDNALQRVAAALAAAFADSGWEQLRYVSRWNPAGDVGADDFWRVQGGQPTQDFPASTEAFLAVQEAALAHWRLTQQLGQPRWFQMTLQLDRQGRYSADFDYRESYEAGDVIRGS
jgi:hypothetical protein